MAGFPTVDDLRNASEFGIAATKGFNAFPGSPNWGGTWLTAGYPAAGAAPATTPGTAYSAAQGSGFGSLHLPDSSPARKYVIAHASASGLACGVWLVDRLVAVGGLPIVGTGDKTVNSVALPRYTDGNLVMAWLEVAVATTGSWTATMTYTNQDNVAGQVGPTYTLGSSASVGSMLGPLPMAAGDTGVRAVEKITLPTAGTAGSVNLVLARLLCCVSSQLNEPSEVDLLSQLLAPVRIYDGATLMWFIQGVGTGSVMSSQSRFAVG